ncbi:MAG TPA: hypothetical protein P5052_03600 [Candidatus Paceibacterota bacterium]|jgi:hypothetical protein|nr:hypothetical protein [Candidatus Paceibacterota bacterium]
MIKKIAKKSLLILLLFIITIYGVLTPMKQGYNSWAIAAGTEQD